MKKYTLEQFPKNKDIDASKLSSEQTSIRNNVTVKAFPYEKSRICITCGKEQPITEFYIIRPTTGNRRRSCKDCVLKKSGVTEVGKTRFSTKIFQKGYRRCSACKAIKPLTEFGKNKTSLGEHSNTCYDCSQQLHYKYVRKNKEALGDFYVKQWAKLRNIHGTVEEVRAMIIQWKRPIRSIDNKEFTTLIAFAKYLLSEYSIPISSTKKRIYKGYSEEDCKLQKPISYRKQ